MAGKNAPYKFKAPGAPNVKTADTFTLDAPVPRALLDPTRPVHTWRLDRATANQLNDILARLEDTPDGTPEHADLLDQLRSLPGCPDTFGDDRAVIVLEITTITIH